MRLSIYPDGAIVVTAPRLFGIQAIEEFVEKHALWVRRKVAASAGREIIRLSRGDIPRLKREALALAHVQAAHYARRYGVSYKKITIRAQKSRWGSCSQAGNLSFNYRVAALPREIAEYIIVHEICHLAAFDHSPSFWRLVEREVPDHKRVRARLRSIAFIYSV